MKSTPNSSIKDFIDILRKEVDLVLQQKTGWGRNELKIQLEQAYSRATIEFITR